jgi:hypothetical protein
MSWQWGRRRKVEMTRIATQKAQFFVHLGKTNHLIIIFIRREIQIILIFENFNSKKKKSNNTLAQQK